MKARTLTCEHGAFLDTEDCFYCTASSAAEVCPECHHSGKVDESGLCQERVRVDGGFGRRKPCLHRCVFPPAPEQKPRLCENGQQHRYGEWQRASFPNEWERQCKVCGHVDHGHPAPPADSDEPPERIKLTPFGDGFICDARTPSMASTAKAGEPIEYARVVGPQGQERLSSDEQAEQLLQQIIETPAGERIRMKCGAADLRSVITDLLPSLGAVAGLEGSADAAIRAAVNATLYDEGFHAGVAACVERLKAKSKTWNYCYMSASAAVRLMITELASLTESAPPAQQEGEEHPRGFDDGSDVLLDLLLFIHGDSITIPWEQVKTFRDLQVARKITKAVNEDRSITIRADICERHTRVSIGVDSK